MALITEFQESAFRLGWPLKTDIDISIWFYIIIFLIEFELTTLAWYLQDFTPGGDTGILIFYTAFHNNVP